VADLYWSSSENVAYYAWFQNFDVGFQLRNDKDTTLYVRPVRAF
jgi:hypothetical protein